MVFRRHDAACVVSQVCEGVENDIVLFVLYWNVLWTSCRILDTLMYYVNFVVLQCAGDLTKFCGVAYAGDVMYSAVVYFVRKYASVKIHFFKCGTVCRRPNAVVLCYSVLVMLVVLCYSALETYV